METLASSGKEPQDINPLVSNDGVGWVEQANRVKDPEKGSLGSDQRNEVLETDRGQGKWERQVLSAKHLSEAHLITPAPHSSPGPPCSCGHEGLCVLHTCPPHLLPHSLLPSSGSVSKGPGLSPSGLAPTQQSLLNKGTPTM